MAALARSAPAKTVAPSRFTSRASRLEIDILVIYPIPMNARSGAAWPAVSAGVGLVAVSYGLARYGYGLLLPDMRAAFGLSTTALGLVASTAYASYLLAVASAGALTARFGPRAVVISGGALAVAGMTVIAVAPSGAVLAVGVFFAGGSGGLVFPP